jgi:6-pyruvoyltetrahydropterin/6-carboxytetrahydropterin synthase
MPPHASLTRRVTFAAAHRYRRPEWSDERNAQVFGACARPSYHGHSYVCHVTVRGPVDGETGFCVDLALLDRVLHDEVRERFDHRNLNVDVPEFADGALVPTGENLASTCARACSGGSTPRSAPPRRASRACRWRRTSR